MDTMQAVVFHGPHDVRVEELPRPEVEEPGDVLLKVDRAAICGAWRWRREPRSAMST